MNLLLKPLLTSIGRHFLTWVAGILVAWGYAANMHGDTFTLVFSVQDLVAGALAVFALAGSYLEKRRQAQLTEAARRMPGGSSAQEVAANAPWVKLSALGRVLPALVLALLLPAMASAQSIRGQALELARQAAAQAAPQGAPTVASIAQNPRTWLRVAEATYVSAMVYDTWNACSVMRATGSVPTNAMVPSSCSKLVATKAPVAIGALLAAERLWPDDSCTSGCVLRQVEAIGALFGSALLTLATPQTQPEGPLAAVSTRRLAVAFTLRR